MSYIDMNQPWIYMYSPPWSPLHLPLYLKYYFSKEQIC